jgi:hypothetical protein
VDFPEISNIYQLISYILYVVILIFYKQSKDRKIEQLEEIIKKHLSDDAARLLMQDKGDSNETVNR